MLKGKVRDPIVRPIAGAAAVHSTEYRPLSFRRTAVGFQAALIAAAVDGGILRYTSPLSMTYCSTAGAAAIIATEAIRL